MFFEIIRNRRSVRSFTDKKIDNEKIEDLKEAALRPPSSRSLNPWEFIFVTDKDILQKLSDAKPHGASFLKSAPLGIAVFADPEKCDVWIEDCSIASIYIQLAAESLGLKSCWCQIRKRQDKNGDEAEIYVKKLLNIPEKYKVLSIIAAGYPSSEPKGHDNSYVKSQMNKIHSNSF
ncbi:MAG: nitroreductase family protein [Thermodesulfobacteriota bacterium]